MVEQLPMTKLYSLQTIQAAGANLPDATSIISKIHPFSKVAFIFKLMMQFNVLWD